MPRKKKPKTKPDHYVRSQHGAQLCKLVREIDGTDAGRWPIDVAEKVAATANRAFNEKASPKCWRQRYTAATRTLDAKGQQLRARIRAAMKAKGVSTITDLAERCPNLSRPQLDYRVRGQIPWTDDQLAEVGKALGIDLAGHMDGDKQSELPLAENGDGDPSLAQPKGLVYDGPGSGIVPPFNEPCQLAPSGTVAAARDSLAAWARMHLPAGVSIFTALKEMGILPDGKDDDANARIECAKEILRDQWKRFVRSGKWSDPHRIHTALSVLEGATPPWPIKAEKNGAEGNG